MAGEASNSWIVYAILVLLLALPAAGDEWPQWRGPDRSGVSRETGLLSRWPEGGPPRVWTVYVGGGYSSVAVTGGRLFTMGSRAGAEFVVAYDAEAGTELWARRVGPAYRNARGSGPRSTPTVSEGWLYALGASGDLWCLSIRTGEPRWQVNLLDRFGGENIEWGLSESPLVDGDRVVVGAGGRDASIVALDRRDGKTLWRSRGLDDPPSYASAVVRDVDGVRQIIHVTSAAAVGLAAEDGRPLWRYERAANDTANCTTPLVHDDLVFLTSAYDTGAALLRLHANGVEEVYFTREMMNHHGGVVLLDGHVYGFSNRRLTCLDLETGEPAWRDRSVGKGSLTAAGGMLYVLSEHGVVGLIEATPEAYREVSRFEIDMRGRKSWAHPVVANGRLYVRGADMLRCYDVRARRR